VNISNASVSHKLTVLGLAVLSTILIPASARAEGPTVSGLPETVTGTQAPVPFSGPTGTTYTTFTIATPATGTISATSPYNPFNAWCANAYGYIQGTLETYTAYNSYDPNLWAKGNEGNQKQWEEINWVINNRKGHSGTLNPSVSDVQLVIHDILIPGYDTADLSADGKTLLSDAGTYGPGFVPVGGQLLAIVLYNAGINPNDGPTSVQDVILQYPLPTTPQTPGIKLVKSANVSTAKCQDKVTYSYTVTNTGNVTLTNIVVTDDNATPGFGGDDFQVGTIASLAPGASVTLYQTVYLPQTLNAVDASGTPSSHTLITKALPNGNIQVTLLEDTSLVDNSYGVASSPDWGSQGNSPWNHLWQDSAEFQFVDGAGNVVLDFAADYVSLSNQYPSGVGTAGISGGAGQLFSGNASNIVSIDTTITDNLNQNGNAGSWYTNSPPPSYPNWQFQCGYTVVVKSSCFGKNGYGGCNIKKIQHGSCKNGNPYQCQPKPICKNITNTATATVTVTVNGKTQTLTATAKATVTLSPGGQQSCQPTPCQCNCWNCQHGDHDHCQNTQCQDEQCKQQQCPQQQKPCNQQQWSKQCYQKFNQCNRSW